MSSTDLAYAATTRSYAAGAQTPKSRRNAVLFRVLTSWYGSAVVFVPQIRFYTRDGTGKAGETYEEKDGIVTFEAGEAMCGTEIVYGAMQCALQLGYGAMRCATPR
eukprot:921537-Rhodomonas_salina.1